MAMAYKTRSMTKKTNLGKLVDGVPIVPMAAAYLALVLPSPVLRADATGIFFPIGMYFLIQEDKKPKSKQTVDISGKGLLNDLALWGIVSYAFLNGTNKLIPTSIAASFDQAYGRQG